MIMSVPLQESECSVTRYRGRHRAPSHTARRVTVAALAVGAPLATATPANAAINPDTVRAAIIQCESGNRNIPNSSGESTASGYYQFTNGTWKRYGGTTTRAMDASRAEQDRVFDNAIKLNGTRDWEADPRSEACWRPKIGTVEAQAPAEGRRSNGRTAEQSDTGKRRAGDTSIPDGYVVKDGDTLGKLAKRFDVEGGHRAIAEANGIANPDRIFVGQTLN